MTTHKISCAKCCKPQCTCDGKDRNLCTPDPDPENEYPGCICPVVEIDLSETSSYEACVDYLSAECFYPYDGWGTVFNFKFLTDDCDIIVKNLRIKLVACEHAGDENCEVLWEYTYPCYTISPFIGDEPAEEWGHCSEPISIFVPYHTYDYVYGLWSCDYNFVGFPIRFEFSYDSMCTQVGASGGKCVTVGTWVTTAPRWWPGPRWEIQTISSDLSVCTRADTTVVLPVTVTNIEPPSPIPGDLGFRDIYFGFNNISGFFSWGAYHSCAGTCGASDPYNFMCPHVPTGGSVSFNVYGAPGTGNQAPQCGCNQIPLATCMVSSMQSSPQ